MPGERRARQKMRREQSREREPAASGPFRGKTAERKFSQKQRQKRNDTE